MRAAAMIGLTLLAMTGPASAQSGDGLVAIYLTGETLTTRCRSFLTLVRNQNRGASQVVYDAALCRGFVTGVLDAIAFEEIAGRREHVAAFCVPRGVEGDVVTEIVANFGDRNPAKRSGSAYAMVRLAMADVYPCR